MPVKPTPAVQRVIARTQLQGECWVFQGKRLPNGYGVVGVSGKYPYVHRVVYEAIHGPIPAGMEIDHVKANGCTNKACVNPAHLEAVTPKENTRRSDSVAARNGRKTHCIHGHPYDTANTCYVTRRSGPNVGTTARFCRTCSNLSKQRQLAKRQQPSQTDIPY